VQITPFFGLFAQTFWLLWQRERLTALPLCADSKILIAIGNGLSP
jgi:hypothetical protein